MCIFLVFDDNGFRDEDETGASDGEEVVFVPYLHQTI